jgi:hypothetical protein
MSATPPSPSPRILGRWANRILIWGLVLAMAATVLLVVQGSDAFLEGLVAVGAFGLLLTALPAVLFLYYFRRAPAPAVPRETRTAIYFSAVTLLLFGAVLALGFGGAANVVIGTMLAIVGVATIVRALRFSSPATSDAKLAYGRSSVVGAFLFLVLVVMLPKFACGCGGGKDKAYKAQLKSDLRNLVTAEEAFFADHHRYALMPELVKDTVFFASSGDSLVVVAADKTGWRAVGTHWYLANFTCGIWAGKRPPDDTRGAGEGQVLCWSS